MTSPVTAEDLEDAFHADATEQAREWLVSARVSVSRYQGELEMLFPAVARGCGRALLPSGWRTDDAARVLMLVPAPSADRVIGLYQHGDADERRAVLLALDYIDLDNSARSWLRMRCAATTPG